MLLYPFPVLLLPPVAARSFVPEPVALIVAVLQLPGAMERVETESPHPCSNPAEGLRTRQGLLLALCGSSVSWGTLLVRLQLTFA